MTHRTLERAIGVLLVLEELGRALGSWREYHAEPMNLLWALWATFAVFLLAAVNLVRASRHRDTRVDWISLAGCLAWIGFVLWFGAAIGNLVDFRPLVNVIVTFVLGGFSLRNALQRAA